VGTGLFKCRIVTVRCNLAIEMKKFVCAAVLLLLGSVSATKKPSEVEVRSSRCSSLTKSDKKRLSKCGFI
jgi:hypothetical protein